MRFISGPSQSGRPRKSEMPKLEYFVKENSTRRKTLALQMAPNMLIQILRLIKGFFLTLNTVDTKTFQ
jgi:hypothetical protein